MNPSPLPGTGRCKEETEKSSDSCEQVPEHSTDPEGKVQPNVLPAGAATRTPAVGTRFRAHLGAGPEPLDPPCCSFTPTATERDQGTGCRGAMGSPSDSACLALANSQKPSRVAQRP